MFAIPFVIFRFVRLFFFFFRKNPPLFWGVSYSFYLYCSIVLFLECRVMISSGLCFVYFRENPDIIGAVPPPDKDG